MKAKNPRMAAAVCWIPSKRGTNLLQKIEIAMRMSEADDGDGVGEPVGDLGAGEVGEGMEKNRRQSKNEGRPDNDAESAGPFGEEEECRKEERKGDDVDDDRNDDRGRRTDEVVDKIVLTGDERTGEVEQI